MTSNNANGMLKASGQELVDMHNAGNPAGLAELQRRYAKRQRPGTKRFLQKCGANPELISPSTPEAATPKGSALKTLAEPVTEAVCVDEMTFEEQVRFLVTVLASPAPAQAKVEPKAKPKATKTHRNLPAGPSGVNVISEQNDDEWLVYTPGKGDRDGNIMPLKGEYEYMMSVVGAGDTLKDARDDFYAQLQHFLPRAFRKTVDNRGQQAKQVATLTKHKMPEEMSRDELKAALNLPSSSKMRTAKMIEQLNAQATNTQQATAPAPAKPKATQPNARVQNLMAGVDLKQVYTQMHGG